ncbi:MAG: polymer-forming cytoskeletal protein [Dehalococcoidia bacterium]|nr:polymer-forming cytoskeletal protein [Dehalococcoidia bacterium]
MKRPDESGFMMALALVMLVMGSIVIVPSMSTASSMLKINRISETNTAAAYAAEAGIADVIWRLNNNETPAFPYTLAEPINGFTITITEAAPSYTEAFSTTYTLNSAAMQVTVPKGQVMVKVIHNTGSSPFYYGIVALSGDITMSNYARVYSTPAGYGDVFSNGNIICHNSSVIEGDAGATGSISSDHVEGTSSPNQPEKEFETMDMTWYLDQANAGGYYSGTMNLWKANNYNLGPKHITGDLYIGQSTVNLNGVVWVDGRVDINNSTTITGTSYIVCNGSFAISNNSVIVGNPTFISNNSNMVLSNSSAVGSLYAPNGAIYISNSATVYGSIVGQSVQMDNSATVNYPVNLQSNPPPGFSGGNGTLLTSYCYY